LVEVRDDPIADGHGAHARADGLNHADRFVAEQERPGPVQRAIDAVQVAVA
jgi:hypothetical protein